MIIAFLDLLGFKNVMKRNKLTASDALRNFNHSINTILDDSLHLNERSTISSFEHLINISDSLIIGCITNPDLFIEQLCNLVSHIFITYSRPFEKAITDINDVKSDKVYSVNTLHKAFPLLFRGGVSCGEDVLFESVTHINNGVTKEALTVYGPPYIEAVLLEKACKGPRLFCNEKLIKLLDKSKKVIRHVDSTNDLYEIVWTYHACETLENSTDKKANIDKRINHFLLQRALNIYNYYLSDKNTNNDICQHYFEFIKLICRGILKYAIDNEVSYDSVVNSLKCKLKDIEIFNYDKIDLDFISEEKQGNNHPIRMTKGSRI